MSPPSNPDLLGLPAEIHLMIIGYIADITSLSALSATSRLFRATLRRTIVKLKTLYVVAACGDARAAYRLARTSKLVKDVLIPVTQEFWHSTRPYARRRRCGTKWRKIRGNGGMMLSGEARERLVGYVREKISNVCPAG